MCGAGTEYAPREKTFEPQGAKRTESMRAMDKNWCNGRYTRCVVRVQRTYHRKNQIKHEIAEEKGTNGDSFKRVRGSNGGLERSWLADPWIMI